MPLYDYECPRCGNRFEELVFGSDKKVNCPKCQAEAERKMSVFAAPATKGAATDFGGGCPPGGQCAPGGG
jgi:putative FmdB family regulatory protein